jgi:hypothetical protein
MTDFLIDDPNVDWPDRIPEIATEDPVLGGLNGPVNIPHQFLSNRILYLKRVLDGLEREVADLTPLLSHIADTAPHEATATPAPDRVILRDAAGRAQIAEPSANADISNKKYVDDAIAGISGADVTKEYVDSHINAANAHSATSLATAGRLIIRDANGRARIAAPSVDADIATKGYVDSAVTSGPAGADGYTVFLTNPAHVFPAGTSAATAGNTGAINVIVFKGGAQIAATIGTITGQVTGLTTSIANNNSTSANFTVSVTTSLTTKSGVLTIPITADGKSFTAKFSWSLGLTGATGNTGSTGSAGADGYTVFLTNSAHVFPAGTDSATEDNTGAINVIVFKGGAQIAATIGAITGQVTGLTTSIANNNSTSANFTVSVTTSLTTRSGVLTIPITADGKSFTAKFSWSLGLTGAVGATGPQGPKGDPAMPSTYASKVWAWQGTVTVRGGGSRTGVVLSRIYNDGTQENYALFDSGSYIVGNG